MNGSSGVLENAGGGRFLKLLRCNHKMRAKRIRKTAAPPTAMPAIAPVESGGVELVSGPGPGPDPSPGTLVGVTVDVPETRPLVAVTDDPLPAVAVGTLPEAVTDVPPIWEATVAS